jgi:hypothetical protein
MAERKPCRLCGRVGKLRNEHVLPDWLTDHIRSRNPGPIKHVREDRSGEQRTWMSDRLSLLVGGICERCNTVRLSKLEVKMKTLLLKGHLAERTGACGCGYPDG